MNVTDATMRVIIDGQAYLHARFLALQHELYGKPVNEEMHNAWEDEWKKETANLIETLVAQQVLPFDEDENNE